MAVAIRQLRYSLTLAEELHFGHTAEKLNISQPHLNANLKRLGLIPVYFRSLSNNVSHDGDKEWPRDAQTSFVVMLHQRPDTPTGFI